MTDAYGTVGHLTAAVTYAPKMILEARKVRFALQVNEGPQFLMGSLTLTGLEPKDAADLQKKWPLKPGDVFDTSATRKFSTDEMLPLFRRLGLRSNGLEVKEAPAPQTVNVEISVRK